MLAQPAEITVAAPSSPPPATFSPGAASGADSLEPDPAAAPLAPPAATAENPPETLWLTPSGGIQASVSAASAGQAPNRSAIEATASDHGGQVTAPQTGLQVNAGFGFTAPNAETGRVGVSANLLGGSSSASVPKLSGSDPYAVPVEPRTPDRDAGVGVSYTVPTGGGTSVSLSGSVGVASYAPDEPMRKPIGMTSLRLSF
ncbi:MAG: hypothetical protein QJR07_19120 [Acetobacteraceae bacterium]|nr:hypothetical protein [Acetobacteraceae bacterium]